MMILTSDLPFESSSLVSALRHILLLESISTIPHPFAMPDQADSDTRQADPPKSSGDQSLNSGSETRHPEIVPFELSSENAKSGFPRWFAVYFLITFTAVHIVAFEIWHLFIQPHPLIAFGCWICALVVFASVAYHMYVHRFGHQTIAKRMCLSLSIGVAGLFIAFGSHDGMTFCSNALFANHSQPEHEEVESKNDTEILQEPGENHQDSSHETHHAPGLAEWTRLVVAICIAVTGLCYLENEHHHLPEKRLVEHPAIVDGVRKPGSGEPIKHLVIPLTAPNWVPDCREGKAGFPTKDKNDKPLYLECKDITADIALLNELPFNCNWQQLLRAIQPHLGSLESIWLFGSNGEMDQQTRVPGPVPYRESVAGGSAGYVRLATSFIAPYLRDETQIFVFENQGAEKLRFQDYANVDQTIRLILREINSRFAVREAQIAIDATGGLKTVSIVGAAATFNREACFQYVDSTAGQQSRVLIYSIRNEHDPKSDWSA